MAKLHGEPADQDLLARIRAGDSHAFEQVFRAYYPELVDFANQYLLARDDAEELVAAMFAYLYDAREGWHIKTTIRAYLFGAVRYRVFNHVRTTRRERLRHELLFASEHDSVVPALLGNPEDIIVGKEDERQQRQAIAQAFQHLPPKARLVISLRWRNQMSFDEIAEILNVSSSAVQMQLSRAMHALRKIAVEYLR